ncbi:MAG: hypothetical protein DME21_10340 [Verrucomicrobia bacterium]|nr:MAG: hypothetical protein DME21_10340 [Verrucomicrobiota bacterium]
MVAQKLQPYAVPGRFIVVLKHGHSAAEVANTLGFEPSHTYAHALNGFAAEIPEELLQPLREDPRVDFIESDLRLFSSAQTIPTGVKRHHHRRQWHCALSVFDQHQAGRQRNLSRPCNGLEGRL